MDVMVEKRKDVLNDPWVKGIKNEKGKFNKSINMYAITISCDRLLTREDDIRFIDFSSEKICNMFSNSHYQCYLICRKFLINKKSRVEHYKKLWSHFKKEKKVDNFDLGCEILGEANDDLFYCGIAKTRLNNIASMLKMVSVASTSYVLFLSRDFDIDLESDIRKLANIAYRDCKRELCEFMYKRNYILVRWGSSSIDAEIDLVYNPDFISL